MVETLETAHPEQTFIKKTELNTMLDKRLNFFTCHA